MLETGRLPDISDNEYDQISLSYLKMIHQLLQSTMYGPHLQGFLENIVSWGGSIFGVYNLRQRSLILTITSQDPTSSSFKSKFDANTEM